MYTVYQSFFTTVFFAQALQLQLAFLGSANRVAPKLLANCVYHQPTLGGEHALDCHGSGPMFVSIQELKINSAAAPPKKSKPLMPLPKS